MDNLTIVKNLKKITPTIIKNIIKIYIEVYFTYSSRYLFLKKETLFLIEDFLAFGKIDSLVYLTEHKQLNLNHIIYIILLGLSEK